MSKLFVGQTGTGKTTYIKNEINNVNSKVIILDYNNQYDDQDGKYIVVDDINPFLGEISLRDSIALNAGYLDYSFCLFNMCKDIFKETPEYKELDESVRETEIFNLSKLGIIEEATERLLISWDPIENDRGRELNDVIPTKKNKKQIPLESAIKTILSSDKTILKMKNLHSSQLRAITFIILSRISFISKEKFVVVADNLTTLFSQGNIKLLLKNIKHENLDFYLAFNKVSNAPKSFFDFITKYHIFRFENNMDHKELTSFGIPVNKNIKKLKDGECIVFEKETSNLLEVR